jgi:hypothetical protein
LINSIKGNARKCKRCVLKSKQNNKNDIYEEMFLPLVGFQKNQLGVGHGCELHNFRHKERKKEYFYQLQL